MKTQNIIIVALAIIVLWLSFKLYNSSTDTKIIEAKTSVKSIEKKSDINDKKIDSAFNEIEKQSSESVKKSTTKKIQYEKPIIKDTTDMYMYEYIVNYRPK
jgi:hypothetical protein